MRKQNTRLAVALLAGLALVGAACGSDDDGGGATDTTAASNTTAGGSTATTAGGSATPGGGTAKCSNVTIAYQGPLTGDAAGLGKPITQGAQLAIDQFNAANADCQIKYQQEDS